MLVIGGPTAAGKTAAAIHVACLWGARIVGADAMQVYRGLDIGTAKPPRSVLRRFPHACVDVRDLDEEFSVADFVATVDELAQQKPTPFVVLPGEYSALLGRRFVMTPSEAIDLAKLFGAQVAVLTHHETKVVRRWPVGWMVRVEPPNPDEFPGWFRIPVPGELIPFPWETA